MANNSTEQVRSAKQTNSVPITGVHETYQFIPLSGEASFVLALVGPVLGATAKAA
jgi:hypothetical protein